jgi:hypothetical protein
MWFVASRPAAETSLAGRCYELAAFVVELKLP